MEHRPRLHLLGIAAVLAAAAISFTVQARTFMTQAEALAAAFPGAKVQREVAYLTPEQLAAAKKESGVEFADRMIVRYSAPGGFAYFDTHRVRTLPETVMIVVTRDGSVGRIDILSFDEPTDYLPKRRWMDQFLHRRLNDDLSLKKAIRPISGASLSGRAVTNATRKVLALHHVIGVK